MISISRFLHELREKQYPYLYVNKKVNVRTVITVDTTRNRMLPQSLQPQPVKVQAFLLSSPNNRINYFECLLGLVYWNQTINNANVYT